MPTTRRPNTLTYTIQIDKDVVRDIKHLLADEGGTMMGFLEEAAERYLRVRQKLSEPSFLAEG